MKLATVKNAPEWLKIDTRSGIYWIDIYRANRKPQRLTRSTKIKTNKERAKIEGEKIISRWLGAGLDGSALRLRFSDVADQILQYEQTNRKGTQVNASIYIPRLVAEFGHLYVDQITEGLFKNYESKFRVEHPGMHFFSYFKHMSLVMNHAYRLGALPRPWNPKMTKDQAKPARVLTEEEKEALLKVAPPDLRDQMIIAMTMGMRLREHLLLSWDRVDLKANTIHLRPEDTKTKKGRTISISPQVFSVLIRRREKSDSPWVFPNKKNPEKPTWSNKSAWRTAKKKAGIKGRCRYHDLRHTFLTECARLVTDGRVGTAKITDYCGLSIRVFERTYLHLTSEDTKSVAGLIAVKLR